MPCWLKTQFKLGLMNLTYSKELRPFLESLLKGSNRSF